MNFRLRPNVSCVRWEKYRKGRVIPPDKIMRVETKELNDVTRKLASGSFIQLPDGVTHYELGGNDSGKRVVLIHGFSVPYFIYDPTFDFLTQSGFRVLRYDLFGRGFSDRPNTRYNLDFFVKQLADLLDALRFTYHPRRGRLPSLIALSMGGPIASAFAVRYPECVDKLVFIDPTGAKPIAFSPMLKAARIPFVAEAVLGIVGGDALVKSIAGDFFDPALADHFIEQYKVQMQYKGFLHAILSTLQNNMLGEFMNVYKQLGTMDKRILMFWGRNDNTVPFDHSNSLRDALPNVGFHAIENCGHIPHYEKPEEVNPILLEFLRKE